MTKHIIHKRSHHRPKPLVADTTASSAISDLRWKNGTAFFSVEMSRSDFKEWADSGSLGGWYNENLR